MANWKGEDLGRRKHLIKSWGEDISGKAIELSCREIKSEDTSI